MKEKNFIVIPAYNEEKRISETLKDIKQFTTKKRFSIIVVDDGSSDNTYDIAKKNEVMAIRHMINLGKGAALKTGCDIAVSENATNIVVIDADTQHKAADIPLFMKKLKTKDIVFGVRKFDKNMPTILKLGNAFITKTLSFLYGIDIPDVLCGFRAFTAESYKRIRWTSTDYAVEVEMLANSSKKGLTYDSVEIKTIYADRYKGTTIFDGLKIVWNMFLFKLTR